MVIKAVFFLSVLCTCVSICDHLASVCCILAVTQHRRSAQSADV
nr:MAG TPA: hypothetical protein [Caudoviricetes sp.]